MIVADEEHEAGARITLERGPGRTPAPFTITCGVYGWMVHTRFFAIELEARADYDAMKTELETLARDCGATDNYEKMVDPIQQFVDRFP